MPARRAVLLAALAAPSLAQAQGARSITFVQPFAAGGNSDLIARALAELMSRELGQTIIVENRPGGGTSIAATAVAQARPDGSMLLMGSASLAINPALQPSLTPRDPQRELMPIGTTYRSSYVLVVHKDVPAPDLAAFIALAKQQPGTLNIGSAGVGSVNHLAQELLRSLAAIDLVHVPYRGAVPALVDLRAARVHGYFGGPSEVMPLVQEGVARALGVTAAARMDQVPGVPAIAETVPGYEVNFWQGLFAPIGTPEPIIARLEAALLRAKNSPEFAARLREANVQLNPGGAAELRALLAAETEKWGRVIRAANIRLE
jgi:tripartite-type tricarboxylate transporter receptor subunit TctC